MKRASNSSSRVMGRSPQAMGAHAVQSRASAFSNPATVNHSRRVSNISTKGVSSIRAITTRIAGSSAQRTKLDRPSTSSVQGAAQVSLIKSSKAHYHGLAISGSMKGMKSVQGPEMGSIAMNARRTITTSHSAQRNAAIPSLTASHRQFSSYPPHEVLTMPSLSPTMETGTLASWEKQPGERVRAGDVIAQVVTDKATVSFDSTEDGWIAKILIPAGTENIDVGTPVAIMVEEESDIAAFKDYSSAATTKEKPASLAESAAANGVKVDAPVAKETAPPAAAATKSFGGATSNDTGRILASPLARVVAAEKGVELTNVKGTGQYNAVVKSDVLEYLPQLEALKASAAATTTAASDATTKKQTPPTPAASSDGDFVDEPLSQMRKVIAKRLTESKQTIPHYYITVEVQMDAINKLRSDFNKQLATTDTPVKLSVNDFIIKAAAAALKKVPEVNSSWQDSFIRRYNYADISVAVSTDAGLITPIVADADIKGLAQISTEMKSLASKARTGKLQPHEFQGGTFTISNLGMFGVTSFSAIINPPQAAILAIGGTTEKVVPNKSFTPENGQPQFKTVSVMNVTASYDHRVVDGAVGAQWMASFKDFMENPTKMLL